MLILGELADGFQEGSPVLRRRGVIQLEQLQAQVAALGLALDGLAKDVRRIFAALDEGFRLAGVAGITVGNMGVSPQRVDVPGRPRRAYRGCA